MANRSCRPALKSLFTGFDLLTFENSLTKDTVVNVPTNLNKAAWELLAYAGIYFVDTQEGTSYEA